jgi:hypothetical protein
MISIEGHGSLAQNLSLLGKSRPISSINTTKQVDEDCRLKERDKGMEKYLKALPED